jgi:hypothetical protein
MTSPSDDPVYGAIKAHRQAYAAYDKAVDRSNANEGDQLAHEENLAAFAALDRSCRRLVAAEFKTIGGLVALLEYMAPLLQEPGAPAMPLEVGVEDQQWETAFGAFCANVGNGLTGMMAAETERIDRVADAIVEATAPLFEDFDMARRAARAAIEAMT